VTGVGYGMYTYDGKYEQITQKRKASCLDKFQLEGEGSNVLRRGEPQVPSCRIEAPGRGGGRELKVVRTCNNFLPMGR